MPGVPAQVLQKQACGEKRRERDGLAVPERVIAELRELTALDGREARAA